MFEYQMIDEYALECEMAKGVYRVSKGQDKEYCMKILSLKNESNTSKFESEVRALRRLKEHEHIITVHEIFEMEDGDLTDIGCFVYDLFTLNMEQYLKLKLNKISERKSRYILKQLAEGISYMHSKFVIHNDIKLENVMIDPSTRKIKIIDFGLAQVLNSKTQMHSVNRVKGTPLYFPPEKFHKGCSWSGVYSDIWSYGIFAFRLVFGKFPFHDKNFNALMKLVCSEPLTFPSNSNPTFKSFVSSILRKNATQRLKLKHILQHPYLTEEEKAK